VTGPKAKLTTARLLEQSSQKAFQQLRQWWRRVPTSQNVKAAPQRAHSCSSFKTVAVISDVLLKNGVRKRWPFAAAKMRGARTRMGCGLREQ
jgi:hypothetical protein